MPHLLQLLLAGLRLQQAPIAAAACEAALSLVRSRRSHSAVSTLCCCAEQMQLGWLYSGLLVSSDSSMHTEMTHSIQKPGAGVLTDNDQEP
jgi:hypothetical protein